jgi:hypothetical protein
MHERTVEKIKRIGHAFGEFTLPELPEGENAVGRLSWSDEDGAELILLNPGPEWPVHDLDATTDVYGLLADNTVITLPGAAVRGHHHSAMVEATLRSMTMLLGADIEPTETWKGLTFRTAHLHEWLALTGLQTQETEHDGDFRVTSVTAGWLPPDPIVVELEGGRVTLGIGLSAPSDSSPEQEFSTRLNIRAASEEAVGLEELERRFLRPLLVFSTLVADRWDAVGFQTVSGPAHKYPIQVLRAGPTATAREWRPGDHAYLFRAEDCEDIEAVLRRWFALYSEAGLPLAVFAETLRSGNSYFPGRLIQSVSGLEGLCGARLGRERKLVATLRKLRDHAGIDPAINGCTDRNLDLLSQARNYYTHLGSRKGFSPDELEGALLKSCRWATALMQSCVMRELGFSVERSSELLAAHYLNWPLPKT